MQPDPQEVNDYWLGSADSSADEFTRQSAIWYSSSSETDEDIRDRFGETLSLAEQGQLRSWQEIPAGRIALVILFDQFSRNLYRGSPDAFKNDSSAVAVADPLLSAGEHQNLPPAYQILLFHPYHHAEDLALQDKTIALYRGLRERVDVSWQALIEGHLNFAIEHRDIVARFGRFPHRNAILGRETTSEEAEFLQKDSRTYGQNS